MPFDGSRSALDPAAVDEVAGYIDCLCTERVADKDSGVLAPLPAAVLDHIAVDQHAGSAIDPNTDSAETHDMIACDLNGLRRRAVDAFRRCPAVASEYIS